MFQRNVKRCSLKELPVTCSLFWFAFLAFVEIRERERDSGEFLQSLEQRETSKTGFFIDSCIHEYLDAVTRAHARKRTQGFACTLIL